MYEDILKRKSGAVMNKYRYEYINKKLKLSQFMNVNNSFYFVDRVKERKIREKRGQRRILVSLRILGAD